MEGITTDDKLLAQDDIDTLLGEAGIEGKYETKGAAENLRHDTHGKPPNSLKFIRRSEDDIRYALSLLRNNAFLEREDDVKVIWNALGTVPMASDFNINIEEKEYVSLGVLHENHLVVKIVKSGE